MSNVSHGIFQNNEGGPSWAQSAKLGELRAVLAPDGSERRNRFLHNVHLYAARSAMSLSPPPGVVLDFGCGTGRFVRLFASRGYRVVGTEVTPEMIESARQYGIPSDARLLVTDGVHVPVPDESVDLIWVCGVLRFVVQLPAYRQIAAEMYRVLKPGKPVVNVEMCTPLAPRTFTEGFEAEGFVTSSARVLHRYGRFDRIFSSQRMPSWCIGGGAWTYAALRTRLDSPHRPVSGQSRCDYLFVWTKRSPASQGGARR